MVSLHPHEGSITTSSTTINFQGGVFQRRNNTMQTSREVFYGMNTVRKGVMIRAANGQTMRRGTHDIIPRAREYVRYIAEHYAHNLS